MYLSFNNSKIIINFFLVSIFLIILQSYLPKIWIYKDIGITLDVFLIFLTFLSLSYDTYLIIFFAFIMGLFQDFVIHVDMIGSYALIKSFIAYFLGLLKSYNSLWSRKRKMFFIYLIYFFHFSIHHYIIINNQLAVILMISLIHALLCFSIFYFLDKIFYDSKELL